MNNHGIQHNSVGTVDSVNTQFSTHPKHHIVSGTPYSSTMQFAEWWICDKGWLQIMTHHIPSLKDAVNIHHSSVIRLT